MGGAVIARKTDTGQVAGRQDRPRPPTSWALEDAPGASSSGTAAARWEGLLGYLAAPLQRSERRATIGPGGGLLERP
jgi:hypothetical protein